ncbi:hypothetical protein F511_27115 [Dorcoceras hygrometricum]|uniref:Uncharacterized protein n=1 Tax=Dorcoceras hygrometricum TaxID=472368 RepID=A0A2Z7CMY7_9LAMI|nr:hypothetical protein F511_27115 [Dorcoceras hygrometricum]
MLFQPSLDGSARASSSAEAPICLSPYHQVIFNLVTLSMGVIDKIVFSCTSVWNISIHQMSDQRLHFVMNVL